MGKGRTTRQSRRYLQLKIKSLFALSPIIRANQQAKKYKVQESSEDED
jgi:hypothetical protein